MILSTDIVARLTEQVSALPITDNDIIEELVDHYLSTLEARVSGGMPEDEAYALTEREIHSADLQAFHNPPAQGQRSVIFGSIVIIAFIAALLIGISPSLEQPIIEPAPQEHTYCLPSWPLDSQLRKISSDFGPRIHPVFKVERHHDGIDLKAHHGAHVLAVADATVIDCDFDMFAGHHIILEHVDCLQSKYYHLSDILVTPGQIVEAGDLIGKVGSSGVSTKPHLHYEILKDNQPEDPRWYLSP